MHVPVRLKTFTRGAFLVRRIKWYQICPSRLSYYSVSNEEEGCRISFLGILWTDFLLECQEVEGAAWEKRELRPPVQSPVSFINCPGTEPPLTFSLVLSFLIHRNLSIQRTDAVYSSKETVTYLDFFIHRIN